ncbi:hypothetical protein FB468_1786 [Leucobacter komagatae]|uniref:Uncharacterized protein n=1 Tax=Leucobacter komagatae TaxID=55969 RepID=A0A542Y6M5_9MICO|nr:hypothetical protein FB468_1786 [Leucobacter komagatae]
MLTLQVSRPRTHTDTHTDTHTLCNLQRVCLTPGVSGIAGVDPIRSVGMPQQEWNQTETATAAPGVGTAAAVYGLALGE